MLKIFVTGDNHIGLKYASHEKAQALAAKRMEAFPAMVDAANREGCELFVITGDLFENTRVPKKDVVSIVETLARFRGTAAVLPGNHDFYDPEAKVWQYFTEAIKQYDNIILLTEYRPYRVNAGEYEATLFPAHCTSLHSAPGENNLGWIKEADVASEPGYRIGIAHGAVAGETIDNEGAYFLMKREELEAIPMDVWLIGHTHVPFPKSLTDDLAPTDRILNAGTHAQTDVNCNTEGLCFIVGIKEDRTVCAKRFVSGNIRFYRKSISLRAGEAIEQIERELAGLPEGSAVDLILEGAVTAEEYEALPADVERLLSRFTEGTYSISAVSKLISEELIDAEFPETSFPAMLLKALLGEPKEAQLTYELLKSLKEGK